MGLFNCHLRNHCCKDKANYSNKIQYKTLFRKYTNVLNLIEHITCSYSKTDCLRLFLKGVYEGLSFKSLANSFHILGDLYLKVL